MRTPLTATIGFAELMLQGDTGELTPDQQRAVEVITRNARRLHRLVTDLLFVAQVDEPGVSLLRTPVDMKRIVREAVQSARLHAQVAGVELRAAGDEGVTVLGDRERLGQLVDNLIANALKFTRAGGRVSVDARRDGDHVRLEVCDTGVGIPEAEVGRVFEAFFRTASAEAGHVPGVGLGLAVAAGIAEAHGGRIDVHSAPGRGTRFVVELPPAG
jgi:signal transduction histidine kinase